MQRSFLANISFLLFVNLLIKPLWIFGVDMQVQNRVGPEEYGFYFALFNFAFLFHMLLDFGINNWNQRLVSQNPERLKAYLPNIVLVKVLLAIGYLILVFATATALQFEKRQLQLLAWLAANRILLSYILYFRSNLSGLHFFRIDAILSVVDRSLMIIGCGYLLLRRGPFRIEDFAIAQTAALGLAAVIAYGSMRSKIGPFKPEWNKRLFKTVLLRSYPFALLGVLMSIYNRIDGVMLERLLGEEGALQAGIYAGAYRLLEAVTMFGFLFSTILLPMFARMLKNNESPARLTGISLQLILAISIGFSITCYFYRAEIMDTLYTASTPYWHLNFGWLILGFIPTSVAYIFGTLLTAAGRLRALNIIAIGGVTLNIVLNAILIPQQQALGATIATLITHVVVALAQVVIAVSSYKLRPPATRLAAITAYIALVIGLGYCSTLLPAWTWYFKFLGIGGLIVLAATLLKMINVGSLRENLND